jgi:hypothetical protein
MFLTRLGGGNTGGKLGGCSAKHAAFEAAKGEVCLRVAFLWRVMGGVARSADDGFRYRRQS